MNLLEYYIHEIITEEIYGCDVRAMVSCDCYGVKQIREHWATVDQWEKEKKKGYFLA